MVHSKRLCALTLPLAIMSTSPTRTIETRHTDMIVRAHRVRVAASVPHSLHCADSCRGDQHDAQFDYYAKRLATCSSDGTITVYDVNGSEQRESAVLTGYVQTSSLTQLLCCAGVTTCPCCANRRHTGPVWEVAWAHPKFGAMIASCGYDRQVIVHKESAEHTWQPMHFHRDHESSGPSVCMPCAQLQCARGSRPYPHGAQSTPWLGPRTSTAWCSPVRRQTGGCRCSPTKVRSAVQVVPACSAPMAGALGCNVLHAIVCADDNSWSVVPIMDSKYGCNSVAWAPYGHLGSHVRTPVSPCVALAGSHMARA